MKVKMSAPSQRRAQQGGSASGGKNILEKFTPLNHLAFQNKIMFGKKIKKYSKTKLESYLTGAIFCLIFLNGFLLWGNAMAANIHICDTAVCGQTPGDGSTWSNALDDLPTNLVRGNTYYIADGNYGRHTFNDSCIGDCDITDLITVKKATIEAHGTDTGWDNAYGTGQAVFQPADVIPAADEKTTILFNSSYYTFDGVVNGGSDPDAYGFKVLLHPSYASEEGIYEGYVWGLFVAVSVGHIDATTDIANHKIFNVAAPGHGQSACVEYDADHVCRSDGFLAYFNPAKNGSFNDLEFAYNYASGHKENFNIGGGSNASIHHNYAHQNTTSGLIPGSPNQAHGQNMNLDTVTNVDVYNNMITESRDFLICFHRTFGGNVTNARIYNNIFYKLASDTTFLSGGITASSASLIDAMINTRVYNNTFVDITSMSKGLVWIAESDSPEENKAYVYNNLIYNSGHATVDNGIYSGIIEQANNAWLNSTGYLAGTGNINDLDASSDVFVNYAGGNLNINASSATAIADVIDKGQTTSFLFDYLDNTRPSGSAFDIGAYEYVGAADTTAPATPTGLSVT